MNEILQQRIEEASIEYTMRTGPRCIAGGAFADMAREINKNPAFIAGANYALQNQWISVEEALPEEDGLYFILIDNIHPRVCEFENGTWSGYDNITHWMPIPELKGCEE